MNFKKLFVPNEKTDTYEWLFNVGMGFRILYGFFRLFIAFLLLPLVGTPIVDLLYKTVDRGRHLFDPQDFLMQTAVPFIEHHSATFYVTYFLVSYLFFWGFIDVVLSISMLKHKLWAFPISIYLIGIFIAYEMLRITHTHSFVLAYIIGVDLVLIWLIHKEQKKLELTIQTKNKKDILGA